MPDVLVHLAEGSDGSVRTVLEGMALGLPVVGAKVGVIPDYITHEKNGFLIESADPDQLAPLLRQLAADAELRTRLGQRAREHALTCHTPQIMAEKLEAFCLSLFG